MEGKSHRFFRYVRAVEQALKPKAEVQAPPDTTKTADYMSMTLMQELVAITDYQEDEE